MSNLITFDYSNALNFLKQEEMDSLLPSISLANEMLNQRTGAGNNYLGWLEWPNDYDKEEFKRIKKAAQKIINQSEVLLVIGIGGSYLGAKAALEMLNHSFYNQLSKSKRKAPAIYFLGHHLSSNYYHDLLDILEDKDISVIVISKSGTTTEPAIAFRFIKELIEKKYGKEGAKERIFATTDAEKGALRKLAKEEGYETFNIPDDIGGRYSVLTGVGLLPIAASGVDIEEIMAGAKEGYELFSISDLERNPCHQYAAVRNVLYRKGKTVELMVNYEPSLQYFSEWWKQLFGESEGKDQKGIFPAAVNFTTDLHSMGQYIQDGLRNIFETVLNVQEIRSDLIIQPEKDDLDGLNFLAGKSLHFVNQRAMEGTLLAHTDGEVPNLIVNIPKLTPYYFGQMVYFFEKACGISGYLLGVNPFDQPGVEAYKKNMFALLGKPGYAEEKELLDRRLKK